MDFVLDMKALEKVKVPDVSLTDQTKKILSAEFTANCGCGGRCLSTTT